MLAARLEFGYWVFEGDLIPAQRPSWNYRAEDGGGIVLDMFPHWQYLLEDLFGPVDSASTRGPPRTCRSAGTRQAPGTTRPPTTPPTPCSSSTAA